MAGELLLTTQEQATRTIFKILIAQRCKLSASLTLNNMLALRKLQKIGTFQLWVLDFKHS